MDHFFQPASERIFGCIAPMVPYRSLRQMVGSSSMGESRETSRSGGGMACARIHLKPSTIYAYDRLCQISGDNSSCSWSNSLSERQSSGHRFDQLGNVHTVIGNCPDYMMSRSSIFTPTTTTTYWPLYNYHHQQYFGCNDIGSSLLRMSRKYSSAFASSVNLQFSCGVFVQNKQDWQSPRSASSVFFLTR